MEKKTNKTAFITGASSGIGEAYARRLARDGFDLVLVARRAKLLEEIASELEKSCGVKVRVLPADLSRKEDILRLEDFISENEPLSFLVNNAGFSTAERFIEADIESQEKMLLVHNLATIRLTRAALSGMVDANRGAIINVSSLAGLYPAPYNAVYDGTKAFLVLFTLGLFQELKLSKASGVRVQVVCPGYTRTGFHRAIGVERNVPNFFWLKPEEVVDESLRALEKGKILCVPGMLQKTTTAFLLALPGRIRYSVIRIVER